MTGDVHPDLAAMLVDIDTVRPHSDNPNHGDVDAIVESIEENGYYAPVVVQRATGHILAGSHRWHGLRRLGHTQIPVVWLDVDDERATRIMLADNRTTRLGHDDVAALAALLEQLAESDGGLSGTGYTTGDLDTFLSTSHEPDFEPDTSTIPRLDEHRGDVTCPQCGASFPVTDGRKPAAADEP